MSIKRIIDHAPHVDPLGELVIMGQPVQLHCYLIYCSEVLHEKDRFCGGQALYEVS